MKRFLVLLVVAAAGVIAAAVAVPAPAATVNGASIGQQTVNNQLMAIANNPNYQCFVKADIGLSNESKGQVQIAGAGANGVFNGTYSVDFADYVLEQLIGQQLVLELAQEKGLEITPANMLIGRSLLDQQIQGVLENYAQMLGLPSLPCGGSAQSVLSGVPASVVEQQARAQAAQALLEARAVGAALTSAGTRAYFLAHRAEFDRVCVSDVVVATKTQASSIRALVLSGASSFAAQASANSLDTSDKAKGGAAGCGPLATFGLSAALVGLRVGAVTQPLSDNGAYVLLTITSRTPSTYAASAGLVRSVILAAGQSRAQAELTASLHRATISTDPRYGRVVKGSSALLAPPLSPPRSSLISPSSNVPGVVPASSAS